jgi:hypothetical protein
MSMNIEQPVMSLAAHTEEKLTSNRKTRDCEESCFQEAGSVDDTGESSPLRSEVMALKADNEELLEESQSLTNDILSLAQDYDELKRDFLIQKHENEQLARTVDAISQECDGLRTKIQGQQEEPSKERDDLLVQQLKLKLQNAATERFELKQRVDALERETASMEKFIRATTKSREFAQDRQQSKNVGMLEEAESTSSKQNDESCIGALSVKSRSFGRIRLSDPTLYEDFGSSQGRGTKSHAGAGNHIGRKGRRGSLEMAVAAVKTTFHYTSLWGADEVVPLDGRQEDCHEHTPVRPSAA